MSFISIHTSIRLIAAAACTVLCVTNSASAQNTAPSVEPDPESVAVLRELKKNTPKAAYDYLGRAEDTHVWLLSAPGIMQMVYVPEDGEGAVVGGTLVDANADPISATMQSDFVTRYPKRSAEIVALVREAPEAAQGEQAGDQPISSSEALWRKFILASPIVFQGDAGVPEIITVLDPAQDDTKKVWAALQPLADAKKITLRIMPLALTTPDTIMHISAILNDEEPTTAWRALMEDRLSDMPANFAPETAKKLKRTIDLATELSLRQTPFFIYRASETAPVQVMRGMPKNWADVTQIKAE